jgi:hypothetical protein
MVQEIKIFPKTLEFSIVGSVTVSELMEIIARYSLAEFTLLPNIVVRKEIIEVNKSYPSTPFVKFRDNLGGLGLLEQGNLPDEFTRVGDEQGFNLKCLVSVDK